MGRSIGWDLNNRGLLSQRCGTIKIPPRWKALVTEHKTKFCSSSPVIVTSPFECNIFDIQRTNHMVKRHLPWRQNFQYWKTHLLQRGYTCMLRSFLIVTINYRCRETLTAEKSSFFENETFSPFYTYFNRKYF